MSSSASPSVGSERSENRSRPLLPQVPGSLLLSVEPVKRAASTSMEDLRASYARKASQGPVRYRLGAVSTTSPVVVRSSELVKPSLEAFLPGAQVVQKSASPPEVVRPMAPDRAITWGRCPLIANGRTIAAALKKAEEDKTDLKVEIAPGVVKDISDVQFLSQGGDHHLVYSCKEGETRWVIKVLNDKYLQIKPNEAPWMVARQLICYALNKELEKKSYVVDHLNFDPHLKIAKEYIARKIQMEAVVDEVKQNMKGCLFAPYIPDAFPTTFDPNDPRWQQLKELLHQKLKLEEYVNDVSWDNVRVSGDRIYLIDLHEYEDNRLPSDTESPQMMFMKRSIQSFVNHVQDASAKEQVRAYLLS